MADAVRAYPLFAACGLNCGLCPRFHTVGSSRCPGCAGAGFTAVHPPCGVLSCSLRKGVEHCALCGEYPCKKYDGAGLTDSFITHRNRIRDLDRAKAMGMTAYAAELDEKIGLLKYLLDNCDDGRRKGFYCLAVNLLDIDDVRNVYRQAADTGDIPVKAKAAAVVRLFEDAAAKKDIELKLRKKIG